MFTGALSGEELARAYASLDLFVHTGEFETFCQAIQEAQASGVPTIGPRAGGPIDLIKHGDNGLLLEVDTFEDELPDAARWILDDVRHATLQAAARESVADKTWAALGDQLLGYYTEVLDSYERKVVSLFGRDVALPRWAPARLGQSRRQARRGDTA